MVMAKAMDAGDIFDFLRELALNTVGTTLGTAKDDGLLRVFAFQKL